MILKFPSDIASGQGSLEGLIDFCKDKNLTKALIITDLNLSGTMIFHTLTDLLKDNHISYELFTNVRSNPSPEIVDESAAFYHQNKCDFIIGFGGGSPIDVAKASSLVCSNGGSIRNYFGVNMTVNPGVPVVAIPTTAGTGAEVTQFIVLTENDLSSKTIIVDKHAIPQLAISDPDLMISMPLELTVSTSLDALTHGIEAYLSANSNPYSQGLALKSIDLIYHSLPAVVSNLSDVKGRSDLAWAATLSGLAFSNSSLGMIHSIGFSIENLCHVPHGIAVAMVMPYVLDFNRKAAGIKIAEIGNACGVISTVKAMYDLISELNIPKLKDIGFKAEQINELAQMSLNDPTLAGNPVEPDFNEMVSVIESIYCDDMF